MACNNPIEKASEGLIEANETPDFVEFGDINAVADGDPLPPDIPEMPPTIYAITAISESVYGTVSTDKPAAAPGEIIYLTIAPNPGYRMGSISVKQGHNPLNYEILENNYCRFVMPDGAVTITVNFASLGYKLYSIAINDVAGGSMISNPAGAQQETIPVILTAQPNAGQKLNPGGLQVTSGGQRISVNQINDTDFSFIMPSGAVTVAPQFVAESTVFNTITANATGNGIIAVPASAAAGNQVQFSLIPNSEDYRVRAGSVSTTGVATPTPNNGVYTFTMPGGPVTINAIFEEIPANVVNLTVTGQPTQGSLAVTPLVAGTNTIRAGKTVTLSLQIPNRTDYRFSSINTPGAINRQEVIPGSVWTFTMPEQVMNISVGVERIPVYSVTRGVINNGTVIITGLKVDGTAPQGATITIQGLPNPGYEVTTAPTITGGSAPLTLVGPNQWRFTMGTANLSVGMNFTQFGPLTIYKGGLRLGTTTDGIPDVWDYGGSHLSNVEINAEVGGYNGNTRAIRVFRPIAGAGSSRQEVALSLNVNPAIDLRATNARALSFWIKDCRSVPERFEFVGFGNRNSAQQMLVLDDSATIENTWKQFIIPIPPVTKGGLITRVFFIKFDEMEPGETILIDNIEFLTNYTTPKVESFNFPAAAAVLNSTDPFNPWQYMKGFFTYPPWQDPVWNGPRISLIYEDHATYPDYKIGDGINIMGITLDLSGWFDLDYAVTAGSAAVNNGLVTPTGGAGSSFTIRPRIGTSEAAHTLSFTVSNLVQVINIPAILGVSGPALFATPVSSITESAQYTGTITWSPSLDAAGKFIANTVYTATITLTSKPFFSLQGVGQNYFTVAGATATNAANSGVITAVFPRTPVILIIDDFQTPTGLGGWTGQQNNDWSLHINNWVETLEVGRYAGMVRGANASAWRHFATPINITGYTHISFRINQNGGGPQNTLTFAVRNGAADNWFSHAFTLPSGGMIHTIRIPIAGLTPGGFNPANVTGVRFTISAAGGEHLISHVLAEQ